MMPFDEIKVGDVYRTNTGSEWTVLDKNKEERMVKVIMINTRLPETLNKPFWLKSKSAMFSERNRVLEGYSLLED